MAFTDRIYMVDWNRLTAWLIPAPLRQPRFMALLTALVSPVADVYNRYAAYKEYTAYWLGINSQVCFMEKALNDRYDITDRRIEIVDGISYDAVPLYLQIENKPVKLYTKDEVDAVPVVLYTKAETAIFSADFIVQVPVGVPFNEKEMRAFIDTFRPPAKLYIIQTV